jgi:hypothetical protein
LAIRVRDDQAMTKRDDGINIFYFTVLRIEFYDDASLNLLYQWRATLD